MNKLARISPDKFKPGPRKLFVKHGKTFLPHDALPLDLRLVGRPGFD